MRKVKSLVDQDGIFTKGKIYQEIVPEDGDVLPGEIWVIDDKGDEFFFWHNTGNVEDECEVVE